MNSITTEFYDISIVLVGDFNPTIINPSWLAFKKLIRESELDNSNNDITHPEISRFTLSLGNIQVTKEKFQINCENEALFEPAKDLVIGIFNILKETPIKGVGINHSYHLKANNAKTYIEFGDFLVPHKNWSDQIENPGIIELKVTEQKKDKTDPVRNTILIRLSEKIPNLGFQYQLNYHIELNKTKGLMVSSAISENWDLSAEKSEIMLNDILTKFKNG